MRNRTEAVGIPFLQEGEDVKRAEDIAGTDLRVEIEGVEKKIQVKSRRANKRYSRLFIQTHEANPEKIYQ
jgi:hypothetical protein